MNDFYTSRGPFMPIASETRSNINPALTFLPAIFLSLLILGIVIYKSNVIPARIANEVSQELKSYPRLASLAHVKGRNLVLEGAIDPFPGMDDAIGRLARIDGLRLDDRLVRLDPAPPYAEMKRNESSIILTGTLNQKDFDSVVSQIHTAFPYLTIQHWVQIEEAVGTPVWLEGLAKGLYALDPVKDLELIGGQNRLQLNGMVPDDSSQTLARVMAASLIHQVEIDNRIVEQTPPGHPELSLSANQDGLELYAAAKSRDMASQLKQTAEDVFGLVIGKIELNQNIESDQVLASVLSLLPELASVKNLRLMGDGIRFVIWGEVSSSNRLEKIARRISELGLTGTVDSRIVVRNSNSPAILTMLRYNNQITLSGSLPSSFVRDQLLQSIHELFTSRSIEYALDIQQQIDYSAWIEVWPQMVQSIPLEVFGIAVNGSQIFLTGMPESEEQSQGIALRVGELLPDYRIHNWMSASSS